MDLLQHVGKEQSKLKQAQTRDITLQDHKKIIKENKITENIGNGQLWCSKFERVVSNNDIYDQYKEDQHKKTCKHYAMIQYDKNQKTGLQQRTSCTSCEDERKRCVALSAWIIGFDDLFRIFQKQIDIDIQIC